VPGACNGSESSRMHCEYFHEIYLASSPSPAVLHQRSGEFWAQLVVRAGFGHVGYVALQEFPCHQDFRSIQRSVPRGILQSSESYEFPVPWIFKYVRAEQFGLQRRWKRASDGTESNFDLIAPNSVWFEAGLVI